MLEGEGYESVLRVRSNLVAQHGCCNFVWNYWTLKCTLASRGGSSTDSFSVGFQRRGRFLSSMSRRAQGSRQLSVP